MLLLFISIHLMLLGQNLENRGTFIWRGNLGYHRTTSTLKNALHMVDVCQKEWIHEEKGELLRRDRDFHYTDFLRLGLKITRNFRWAYRDPRHSWNSVRHFVWVGMLCFSVMKFLKTLWYSQGLVTRAQVKNLLLYICFT